MCLTERSIYHEQNKLIDLLYEELKSSLSCQPRYRGIIIQVLADTINGLKQRS